MSAVTGTWLFEVSTPFGDHRLTIALTEFAGLVSGSAITSSGASKIMSGRKLGRELTFTLPVKDPVEAELYFAMTIGADEASGKVVVDSLLNGTVTGNRVAR
jgi:hypothetical protein